MGHFSALSTFSFKALGTIAQHSGSQMIMRENCVKKSHVYKNDGILTCLTSPLLLYIFIFHYVS